MMCEIVRWSALFAFGYFTVFALLRATEPVDQNWRRDPTLARIIRAAKYGDKL